MPAPAEISCGSAAERVTVGLEQRLGVLGQVAHEVGEAAVVLEVVDPLLADGRVLAGALAHDARRSAGPAAPTLTPALTQRDARRTSGIGMRNG